MSVATLVRDRARNAPDAVAMRQKHRGIWREITWRQYWDTARAAANALRGLGVGPGDRVAILSESRPEWLFADVATVALRAAAVGLHPADPAGAIGHRLAGCGAKVLIAEDQEQVDKALAVLDDCPDLRRIVYLDPRGIRHRYRHQVLTSWDDLLQGGPGPEPELDAAPEDLAALLGEGVLADPPPGPRDLLLSSRPLSHATERAFTTGLNAAAGVVVHFGEAIATVPPELREVQPTIILGDPRMWEEMLAGVTARVAGASRLKRANARLWLRVADGIGATLAAGGGRHTAAGRLRYAAGWLLCYRALRERIGLRRVRYAACPTAPVAPEVLRFFTGIGVPVHQVPGTTEDTAIDEMHRSAA
ncbi:AMP-binding protein [Dactylosporangium sp. CA-139066]|uniref:AMP-binding protein n=1 Tax=Dactylosporangium sp. CA-139066 TaxID=3239930 RepID=UPI003D9164B3